MVEIDTSQITVPIPEPYDDKNENKQRENFYFVVNQLIDLVVQQAPVIDIDLVEAVKNLQYEGVVLDLGHIKIIRTGKTGSAMFT